jgi:hypothetical protein
MSETNGKLTLEEQATNFETMKHIQCVQKFLHDFVRELLERAEKHDQSKLEPPEVALFTEFTSRLASSTYGSKEYEEFRKQLGPALAHHYAKNRHHPEHFPSGNSPEIEQLKDDIEGLHEVSKNLLASNAVNSLRMVKRVIARLQHEVSVLESPVNKMNLLDVLEMFADWKAATMRHHDGNIRYSISRNRERFGLSQQLAEIMANTIELLEE